MAPQFGWRCTVCKGEWYPDAGELKALDGEPVKLPAFVFEIINGAAIAAAFSAIAKGIKAASQDTGLPEENIREMFYKTFPYWTGNIAPNL